MPGLFVFCSIGCCLFRNGVLINAIMELTGVVRLFFVGVLLYLMTGLCFGQEAENIYRSYSKFGFFIQPAFVSGFNLRDSGPTLKFNDTFSYQGGVVYNFAQSGNFNFKAGLTVKTFKTNFDVLYTSPTTNYNYGKDWSGVDLANDIVVSEVVKAEYFVNVSPAVNLVFGFGAGLDLRSGSAEEKVTLTEYDPVSGAGDTFLIIDSGSYQITASADVSVGANYKTGFGLFQLDFFVNTQLLNYPRYGDYMFYDNDNLVTQGTYIVKGNYCGFTLTFSPKKK
jgi:hypothetical protein